MTENHPGSFNFGVLNEHTLGIIMRAAVERSVRHARKRFFEVSPEEKGKREDGSPDIVTRADPECQQIISRMFSECMPGVGIVAEEEHLRVNLDAEHWIVIDPIDGTKSFVQHESHGFVCAVAYVVGDAVRSVCIGDIMSGDVYYFRPGSEKTHRVLDGSGHVPLAIDTELPLAKQKVVLRNRMIEHGRIVNAMVDGAFDRVGGGRCAPLFSKVEITGGSIAAHAARLWKGSVGGVILPSGTQLPWDIVPIIGMCERLGFVFVEIYDREWSLVATATPGASKVPLSWPHETLIIHESRLPELYDWFDNNTDK